MLSLCPVCAQPLPSLCHTCAYLVSPLQGIQPLLDAVVRYLPSPLDVVPATGKVLKTGDTVSVSPSSWPTLVALVFKVQQHPQRGPLAFLRVYAGALVNKMALVNTTLGGNTRERTTKVMQVRPHVRHPPPTQHWPCASGPRCTPGGAGRNPFP